MKFLISICTLLILLSCNNAATNNTEKDTTIPIIIKAKEVPEKRTTVKKEPEVSFKEKIAGNTLMGDFAVRLYQTKETFHYRMNIQYAEVVVNDTLKLPNLGVMPKPVIHKGPAENSCIIGFLDDKNEFHEYKLIAITNQKIKIKTLKHYAVATYRVN
ncbi:MAG: hypothetical protein JWN76_506 [Chitinophagaceae bacterium]|nr:hypothetical protein [Chitinophagaceae bacterium]